MTTVDQKEFEKHLSRELAVFIVNARYEHLDNKTIQQTRFALLDALGVSIAATTLGEGVNTFIEWVREENAQGPCKVFARELTTSPSLAAFANGALAHALDFEDAHDKALVHPNAAVVPAVLAVGQSLPSVSGQELLTAIAVGCDVTCRLGFAVAGTLDQFSWYPPPILSAYGATAAASKLLGLNEGQILDAFSLTMSQATCSAEIKHNPQSQVRAIRDAFPAQAGVVSAQLALKGLTGFNQPLEGKDGFFAGFARGDFAVNALRQGLGQEFAIKELSFKPWPSCRGTHAPIELMLNLCKKYSLKSSDIESITVYSNTLNRMLAEPLASKRAPTTAIDAKFSIPFCIACVVTNGEVNLNSFFPDSLNNKDILSLAERVNYRVDFNFSSPLMARVEVKLGDGRTLESQADSALGCPERPLSEQQLIDKFLHCLSHSADKNQIVNATEFADSVLNIDKADKLPSLFQFL